MRIALALSASAGSAPRVGMALECGQTQQGSIAAPGESDIFTISALGGETIAISSPGSLPQSPYRPCWQLFQPGAMVGDPPTPLGGVDCGLGVRTLPAGGTYSIQVFDGRDNDNTGDYSMSVEALSGAFNGASNGPPAPFCSRADVNGNAGDGTQPIGCGQTLKGDIEVAGETDTFTFVANGGETISISTPGTLTQAPYRPCWQLFAPPPGPGEPSPRVGDATCGYGVRLLPQGGVYTILVSDGDLNDNAGSYSVTLEALSGDFAGNSNGPSSPTCAQLDVNGGPADGTQAIACGQTRSGDIEVAGETDTFTFTGTGGQTVSIGTPGTIPQSPYRPCWLLYAPTPAGGGISEAVGGTTCGQALRTLPRDGTYTIQVFDGNGNDNSGAYSLSLAFLEGCPIPETTTSTTTTSTTTSTVTTTTVATTTSTTSTTSSTSSSSTSTATTTSSTTVTSSTATTTSSTTTSSNTSSTTRPAEVCGNCADDNADGLVDFEDPSCCSEVFSGRLERAEVAPKARGAAGLQLRATLEIPLPQTLPAAPVVIQLRADSSAQALCATLPASAVKPRRRGLGFKDLKRRIPTAQGITRFSLGVRKDGTTVVNALGGRVNAPTIGAEDVHVTWVVGEVDDTRKPLCATVQATFRSARKGAVRFP